MPDTLEINGIKYQRVADHTNDCATELLLRIKGVAKAANTDCAWAAWAIAFHASIDTGKPLPTPPNYHPFLS